MSVRSIRFWRRLTQVGVALAFVLIPVLNRLEFNQLAGNFLSFNLAGLPLADPLAVVQVAAATLSGTTAMVVGAGLVLLLALLLGPVFCSWICPFGLLSELAHQVAPGVRKRNGAAEEETAAVSRSAAGEKKVAVSPGAAEEETAAASRGVSGKKSAGVSLGTAGARPFWGRAGLAAAGVLAVALVAPVPVLNQLSMPGWYSRALQHAVLYREVVWGAGLLLAVLALELALGKRFWCRFVCPQSVLLSLTGMILPKRWQLRFARKACTCPASDRPCLGACSLDLNPRVITPSLRLQCTNCGDCVDACRARGQALTLGFGKPPAKAAEHPLSAAVPPPTAAITEVY